MPALFGCGGDLTMEIIAGQNLNFVFTVIERVRINGKNVTSSSPIPYNIIATNHIRRDPDRISIKGIAGCRSCNTETVTFYEAVEALKTAATLNTYDVGSLAQIYHPDWSASSMALADYSFEQTQQNMHFMQISMDFVQVPIAGSIQNPGFVVGGILA